MCKYSLRCHSIIIRSDSYVINSRNIANVVDVIFNCIKFTCTNYSFCQIFNIDFFNLLLATSLRVAVPLQVTNPG